MGDINKALKSVKLYYGLEDCSGMFKNCVNLEEVDLTDIHNPEDIKNMSSMFENCSSLESIDLSNFDTSNITNSSNMFKNIPTTVDWNYSGSNYSEFNITENESFYSDIFPWNLVTVAKYTFTSTTDTLPTFNSEFTNYTITDVDNGDGTTTRTIISVGKYPTSISFKGCSGLLSVEELDTSNVTDMSRLFYNCKSLSSVNLSNLNTSKVTNMYGMFYYTALTSLDLSNLDTSNVTNMSWMFRNCKSLTSLNVSNWDTSNLTDMSQIFANCTNLTSVDLSHFDTSNVTTMAYIFNNCSKLTSLNLSNWDTGNVNTMAYMFYGCNALTSLDVSTFNTSNVTNMSYMFGCPSLTSLNLSNFNTSKVTDMSYMFRDCSSLSSLDLTSFNTSAVTSSSNMFYNCPASCVVRYDATSWTLATSGTGFNVIFANVSSGDSN